jgi:2-desacetyl-2-hydroxyethyl bacteriochlorophyllide A dehydrogenase
MKNLSVHFVEPYRVEPREEPVPITAPDQVLVKAICSAISPGTEMLVYRGQWPANLAIDESIPALGGKFSYPLKYGYACVGEIVETGASVSREWLGKSVFSFNPHESYFTAKPEHLIPLPESLSPEEAAFIPNMETAVSFLMDGKPLIGERVVVIGQGVVGLLTAGLLAKLPLGLLLSLDNFPLRREKSRGMGARSLDAADGHTFAEIQDLLGLSGLQGGADLVYELSGNPKALDTAIAFTGLGGRIVVGSWYGEKKAALDLGGRFHRARIKLISSQVSTMAPEFSGLWTKTRRLTTAIAALSTVRPAELITHRFSVDRAAEAYEILDKHPERAVQVILEYGENYA